MIPFCGDRSLERALGIDTEIAGDIDQCEQRSTDRLIVGIGMLPRGEVGLVFAAIGRSLGVIDDSIFAAIVLMVFVTTLIAPPWLEAKLKNKANSSTAVE